MGYVIMFLTIFGKGSERMSPINPEQSGTRWSIIEAMREARLHSPQAELDVVARALEQVGREDEGRLAHNERVWLNTRRRLLEKYIASSPYPYHSYHTPVTPKPRLTPDQYRMRRAVRGIQAVIDQYPSTAA